MGFSWEALKEKLQVPKDNESSYENTQWSNRDLIPMPPERRTFGIWSYAGYWVVTGCNISAWTIGATLIALGLSPQHAIGVVVVGGILTGILAVVCGWIGAKQHIGYTVASRFSWGMYGSYFPVILRTFVGCIWFGIQAFWGGQATRALFGAIIPGFAHMKNTFSESSHLATNDFIGLVIWMIAFIAMIMIRPEKIQIAFVVSFVLVAGSFIGILVWAVHNAHGAGTMFHMPSSAPNLGTAWMYGITAVLGAWGGGTIGQSDWTRYADRPVAPTLSQLLVAPLTITVTATIGIIVTSAASDVLGSMVWSPIDLLSQIQEFNHSSPRARAGVFFASLGIVSSQLMLSVVLNSMSVGMDMAGLWPRYINIRRGSYIMAALGIIVQPWQLLNTAAKFLRVMSSFGIFMAPATGILIVDYHFIRKKKLNMDDLYIGDKSSDYWYTKGLNWRAFVAFLFGVWPMLPGLAASVNDYTESSWTGWIRIYNVTFIVGMFISGVLFWVLSFTFPPPRLHKESGIITESFPTDEEYHAEQIVNTHQTKDTKPATLEMSV